MEITKRTVLKTDWTALEMAFLSIITDMDLPFTYRKYFCNQFRYCVREKILLLAAGALAIEEYLFTGW
jgi:hypothetical protein